jgi:hypothetical protein
LQELTDAEFNHELDERIERLQSAWIAVRAGLPTSLGELGRLWVELEEAERALQESWSELARRQDGGSGRL